MDQLKHFIDTHRDAFEDDRLPAGHLERFEKKLPTSHTRHTLLYSMCALLAAASIALLFLVKLYPASTEPQGAEASSCMLKEEIDGLRLYYTMQMNDVVFQIQEISEQRSTPGTQGLLDEMKQVLADSRQFEEQVLPTLPCSNNALLTMNQHYEASLESLQFMLAQMEEMKNEYK